MNEEVLGAFKMNVDVSRIAGIGSSGSSIRKSIEVQVNHLSNSNLNSLMAGISKSSLIFTLLIVAANYSLGHKNRYPLLMACAGASALCLLGYMPLISGSIAAASFAATKIENKDIVGKALNILSLSVQFYYCTSPFSYIFLGLAAGSFYLNNFKIDSELVAVNNATATIYSLTRAALYSSFLFSYGYYPGYLFSFSTTISSFIPMIPSLAYFAYSIYAGRNRAEGMSKESESIGNDGHERVNYDDISPIPGYGGNDLSAVEDITHHHNIILSTGYHDIKSSGFDNVYEDVSCAII